jgi:hypothetical protein
MKNFLNALKRSANRRSFIRKGLVAFGVTAGSSGLLARPEEHSGSLTKGDAAILRFLAAAEILETDFWVQYNELGGVQDSEVPGGSGSPIYTAKLQNLDADFPQYIHDNTEDEFTHENFINAYLASKGADTVSLEQFRVLPGSMATGSSGKPRLTNLMQLTLDTAGFHMPTIEQGGNSLYPSLAQRVTHPEVLRILLSIGPTETAHFQTWHDKAGNAVPLTDPTNGLVFPDLNSPPFGGEDFQTNLIMPEPCPFISRSLPVCSVIRPIETKGAAMGALTFLTKMGLFMGQSKAFSDFMQALAEDADDAKRG